MIKQSLTGLIGNTPLLRLRRIERHFGLFSALYSKLECFNPSGSVKDRAAFFMIEDAFRQGKIREGSTVIDATSGNMGISLSMLSAVYGYEALIVMPDSASEERRALIRGYGGRLLLTDGALGMAGAVEMAEQISAEQRSAFRPSQFENRQNVLAHYDTTGAEIYSSLPEVDILVVGVGTGGTLIGAGRYLKEKRPSVRLVAVEPSESPVLSGGISSPHGIEGIGAGFYPPLFDRRLVDQVTTASTEEAQMMCRILGVREGVFAGFSSGAVLSAAVSLAKRSENFGKSIVMIFADGGEKYLSKL